MTEMLTTLIAGLPKLGLSLSEETARQLCSFGCAVVEQNKVMNLTAITQPDQVAKLHLLDSLSLLTLEDLRDKRLIDVGCGAGFPGVPLKIGKRDIHLTAIDALLKRLNFLETVKKELSLDNFDTIHLRAEEAGQNKDLRESFDVATSRAVANLSVLSEWCLPRVKVGGSFVALKGPSPEEEIEEAKTAVCELGGEFSGVYKVNLPGNITHSIVLIKKISQTPSKYPRKPSDISKRPL